MEIKTLENARFVRDEAGYARLQVEVNGRPCEIMREKALRLDGEIAALGPYDDFLDFSVIVQPSRKHGIDKPTRLHAYTNDVRYVKLVRQFVDAVDSGRFRPGPVVIE